VAAGDSERFIPALRFRFLTPLYDTVVAHTTREATFKRRVLERAAVRDGERVLDLACGTGTLAVQVAREVPGAQVTGLDGDPDILERARAKVEEAGVGVTLDEGLSTDLPYDDSSFDVVLSTLFFHHLSEEAKLRTSREVHRVLRPGGRFVIGDFGRPQDPVMRAAVLGIQLGDGFENTRANVAGRIPKILREAGFANAEVSDRIRTPIGTIEVVVATPQ
jgi:ubiquinone/menaquinone biosynthesis C-methylase UbiE